MTPAGEPTSPAVPPPPPQVDAKAIRDAILALEGSVIDDFQLPVPGDLKDIAKAAAYVSGVIEDRIPALLNSVRSQTWDDGPLHAFEFRRFTIGFPDILLVERANTDNRRRVSVQTGPPMQALEGETRSHNV